MNNKNGRIKTAQDKALERLNYVIDCRASPDFVEVTGIMGGDIVTYRVYDYGSMYER